MAGCDIHMLDWRRTVFLFFHVSGVKVYRRLLISSTGCLTVAADGELSQLATVAIASIHDM